MSFQQTYELHDFEPGSHYIGKMLDPGWKVSIMHSCMDDVLAECNFNVFLQRLGGVSDTIHIERVGFSGDGWYEFVAIHESNTTAMEKAETMLSQLLDYPILDETKFSEAEDSYYTSIGYVQNEQGDWEPEESTETPQPV